MLPDGELSITKILIEISSRNMLLEVQIHYNNKIHKKFSDIKIPIILNSPKFIKLTPDSKNLKIIKFKC